MGKFFKRVYTALIDARMRQARERIRRYQEGRDHYFNGQF